MSDEYSIVMYHGEFNKSRCGYCKKENTCNSHGMTAHVMAVNDYQDLIDRGWRRSGTFCYKPTNATTCCPSYTIRCDALNFKLSKSHKKILKRMNKFLRDGIKECGEKESAHDGESDVASEPQMIPPASATKIDISKIVNKLPKGSDRPPSESAHKVEPSQAMESGDSLPRSAGQNMSKPPCKKAKVLRLERKQAKMAQREAEGISVQPLAKAPKNVEKSLEDFLGEQPVDGKHKLKIKLVCATSREFLSSVEREYELYQKYQTVIHREPPEDVDEFQSFLQHSPLQLKLNSTSPPKGYGSFHQQYWLDDRLIAVGVIDVLRNCVSSVYLFYDPEFSFLSLGTYSSLREIAFMRELQKSCPELKYYYMGFYIHSCPKMRYKGKLQPSYLLCPEVYTWHLITEDLLKKLDRSKYSRFNEDEQARDKDEFQLRHLESVVCLYDNTIMYFEDYIHLHAGDEERRLTLEYGRLVGSPCSRRILLYKN
ncbi:arginyl-tRNA--protein transferase 1-like isoform X1 [Phlebotomus argentipes]|uniref:arginyl-tRNA--protein transferase 1-like isoform X1 n=1 Tax=Phlebotomus argentipes TaxID=94469 RepID=UPI002892AF95|nr:arginyl-tRNA--protein transferase 1-like isoform X1 [Phlebotomus argentipes]